MEQLTINDLLYDESALVAMITKTAVAMSNVETQKAFLDLEYNRQRDVMWSVLSNIPISKRKQVMLQLDKPTQECCVEAILNHIPELYIYGGDKNARKSGSEA